MSHASDPPLSKAPLCDVFLKSFEGFAGRLKKLFPERPMPVVDASVDAYKSAVARSRRQLGYPFAAVRVGGTDVNTEGYNVKALLRRGQLGARRHDPEGGVDATYHLVPVVADVTVIFVTNSAADAYAFAQRWTLAAKQNLFHMLLESEAASDRRAAAPIHVRVDMGTQLQLPDLTADDEGAEFKIEVGAQIRTYMGHVRERLSIRGHTINLGVAATPASVPATLVTDSTTMTRTRRAHTTTDQRGPGPGPGTDPRDPV